MNDNNLKILDQIPLVDVLAGWRHTAQRTNAKGTVAYYLCPWHDDHDPSLVVESKTRDGATAPMFKCYVCGATGYGAVQLAARLMGKPGGRIPDEEMPEVLTELATRCSVELEEETDAEGRRWQTRLRSEITGWSEFRKTELQYADWDGITPILEPGEWTIESLKALGLKVEMSSHKAGKDEVSATAPAEIKTGDVITDFDPDTGEALYRCSFGAGFYGDPKKAEVKTVSEWGREVERLFHVQPVARVIRRKENKEQGGYFVHITKGSRTYPIFMFQYDFGTKKYEPRDVYGNKWIWVGKDENVDAGHQWYGDATLEDFLKDGVMPEQDKRHPYVEIDDKEKKTKQIRFGKIVLCSGPRDAIAVYSHSDAHVVWLNSEQAGFDAKGGAMRPNRWLRALLRKLQSVCVEGGLYVCYDEDETGLKASQAIALNNPQVHWLRLPKELGQVMAGKTIQTPPLTPPLEGRGMPTDGGTADSGSLEGQGMPTDVGIADSGSLEGRGIPTDVGTADSGSLEGRGMPTDGGTADSGSLEGQGMPTDGGTVDSGSLEGRGMPTDTMAAATPRPFEGRGRGGVKAPKPLKDATDFVTRFAEVERLMPADLQHDDPAEWFENAMFDTPTCKFWQWESERKEQDGSSRARYKFDLRNTPVFLRARGIVRRVMQSGDESFSRFFMLGNDHTYYELFVGQKGSNKLVPQIRDIMAEWLRAHSEFNDKKGALSRAIYSAKLETGIMESIETMDFDEKSFGEDFDHFFFHNTAVRVTKDEIKLVPYSTMKQWTNQDAILEGDFHITDRLWHVEEMPYYQAELAKHEAILKAAQVEDEIKQENMRWDQYEQLWHYRLVMDRPLEQMPLHFRFLYNTCRIFWEKEKTQELTKTERQVQDMYFIAMLHAIGSALVRFRSANRQQFIHITDNGTRREDLASGGTGKTAILELFALVRRVLGIDGKALEGSNIILEQELGKVIPGLHNIACIDELPQGFSPKKLYNLPLSVTSRGMYRASVKLTGDDVPKIVISSNEQIDLSSESTSRRAYQILVGDWYHPRSMDGSRPAHTPADDFRSEGVKEIAHNLPPQILNDARNLLLQCCQLFLQLPEVTFTPPRDSRALLRQALAASKDEQFTRWIAGYLSDKRHLGIPIAERELIISLLDFCGIEVGAKTLLSGRARIKNNLDEYLRTSPYVANPNIVMHSNTDHQCGYRRCATWQYPMNPDKTIKTDKDGNRLPRELVKKAPYLKTYYFYRKGQVPFHDFDPAHIGDKDYVQPAPETDPDEVKSE